MSFSFQHPYPTGVQPRNTIPYVKLEYPSNSDDGNPSPSPRSSVKFDQTVRQTPEDSGSDEIDRLIPFFDSEEYRVHQEIEKLALKIRILENKDKLLIESLG